MAFGLRGGGVDSVDQAARGGELAEFKQELLAEVREVLKTSIIESSCPPSSKCVKRTRSRMGAARSFLESLWRPGSGGPDRGAQDGCSGPITPKSRSVRGSWTTCGGCGRLCWTRKFTRIEAAGQRPSTSLSRPKGGGSCAGQAARGRPEARWS